MTTFRIILSFLGVLVFTGCSQSPESYVESYYDSLKSGDVKKLQSFLGESGPQVVKLVASVSPCPNARNEAGTGLIEDEDAQGECLSEAYSELEYEITSSDVSEDGQTATINVKSKYMGKEEEKTFNLVKQDDEWKLNSSKMF